MNNAGINQPTAHRKADPKFWKLDVEAWRRIIDTNVNAPFYMARAVAPHLIARGWGRIVNHITSLRTMIRPGDTPYGPSKAALEAMTTAWAGEFAGTRVTVNAIAPGGAADTQMISPELVTDRARLVRPEVLGPPICWLISAKSDDFTGYCITAEHWDPHASDETNLAKAAAETGWKQLLSATTAPHVAGRRLTRALIPACPLRAPTDPRACPRIGASTVRKTASASRASPTCRP